RSRRRSWRPEICFGARAASPGSSVCTVSNWRLTSDPLGQWIDDRVGRWRTGSDEGQMAVLGFLSAVTITVLVLSIAFYEFFPAPTFILPVLVGGVLLRTRPLAWLCALAVACAALAATIE